MGRMAEDEHETRTKARNLKMKVTVGAFCPCMKFIHNQQFTILFA